MSSTDPANNTEWLDNFDLNARQRAFVLAYLADPNATRAAEAAGYKQAHVQGPRLLSNVRIAEAVAAGRSIIEQAAMMDAEKIAGLWTSLALANPLDLVEHHHVACRYCYGHDHEYQWKTRREFREAHIEAVHKLWHKDDDRLAALNGTINDPRLPTDAGGYGYRDTKAPNPNCPECAGRGTEITRMADTRTLNESARLLYDGVEETRHGKKIKVRDRDRALENLAKHLGMFAGKVAPEEENLFAKWAAQIAQDAVPVPVRPDPPPAHHPLSSPHVPDQDGEEIEP